MNKNSAKTKPNNQKKKKKGVICHNQLFISYLKEFKEQASERGEKSAKTYYSAMCNLKKYPLPLQSGKEAIILKSFGPKICSMLDNRLVKDAAEKGIEPREFLEQSRNVPNEWWEILQKKVEEKRPGAKSRTKKGKVTKLKDPAKSTTADKNENLVKSKAISPSLDQAVSSKSKLEEKNPVIEKGKQNCIDLTQDSNEIDRVATATSFTDDIIMMVDESEFALPEKVVGNDNEPHHSAFVVDDSSSEALFTLRPGQFEIVLCVDTREVSGSRKNRKLKSNINSLKVKWEDRNLQIGDFAWVAKELHSTRPRELVLDFIVERKCVSDLAESIPDGRYREQKMRLRNCGLSNIMYLIEDVKQIDHQKLPPRTLRQAIYNTQVADGFLIKYSTSIKETCQYLDMLTEQLAQEYKGKVLRGFSSTKDAEQSKKSGVVNLVEYTCFMNASRKNVGKTITTVFIQQLMQISGVSYDKAHSITSVYPTMFALCEAYEQCPTLEKRELLLADLKFGLSKRKIGKAVSKIVCQMFS